MFTTNVVNIFALQSLVKKKKNSMDIINML